MCFFKDLKQQHIQLVQTHDDQAVTLQMSDESFHDANEKNCMLMSLKELDIFLVNHIISI